MPARAAVRARRSSADEAGVRMPAPQTHSIVRITTLSPPMRAHTHPMDAAPTERVVAPRAHLLLKHGVRGLRARARSPRISPPPSPCFRPSLFALYAVGS